jgi:hypothetical protein
VYRIKSNKPSKSNKQKVLTQQLSNFSKEDFMEASDKTNTPKSINPSDSIAFIDLQIETNQQVNRNQKYIYFN